MGMKKAMFFSVDALIALLVIVIVILSIKFTVVHENPTMQLEYYSNDLINILSNINPSEINNSNIQQMITDQTLSDKNSMLEQLGELYAEDQQQTINQIFDNLTSGLIGSIYGYGFYIDNNQLYNRSHTNNQLRTSKKLVSGIEHNVTVRGTASRAFLSKIQNPRSSAYLYFGGYVGDGNITHTIILPDDAVIEDAYLELNTPNDFDLIINSIDSGTYTSQHIEPNRASKYGLTPHITKFQPGTNTIKINFHNPESAYIGGGYLKVTFRSNKYEGNIEFFGSSAKKTYRFPGIDGIINLYDSFYVDGLITEAKIYLHYLNNYSTYLTIGNTVVHSSNGSSDEQFITITDPDINLASISKTTFPIRLGTYNLSINQTTLGTADIFVVTDLSGSMEFCVNEPSDQHTSWQWTNPIQYPDLNSSQACGYKWQRTSQCDDNADRRIDVYKQASLDFVTSVLNIEGNQLGFVDYSAEYSLYQNYVQQPCSTRIQEFPDGIVNEHSLSDDTSSLNNHIKAQTTWYGTCICCGVNRAAQNMPNNNERNQNLVIMSDGQANARCSEQGTGSATQDAIQAAQQACNNNISVYTIGFGQSVDHNTLMQMSCGNGNYYPAEDSSDLADVFADIAQDIIDLSYAEQTSVITGNITPSTLYPDSYIEFEFSPDIAEPEFGEITITFETPAFNNTSGQGSFYVSAKPIDARVTSYSGSKWTDKLEINQETVFQLSDYSSDYQGIGDPFNVQIPVDKIMDGNNAVLIRTGLNPINSSPSSPDDKVIYTQRVKALSEYTGTYSKVEGCLWHLDFEDSTSSQLPVPSTYTGTKTCNYKNAVYDEEDAYDNAAYSLFSSLDFDNDGEIFVNFKDIQFDISQSSIPDIPTLYGPVVMEVRVWQ